MATKPSCECWFIASSGLYWSDIPKKPMTLWSNKDTQCPYCSEPAEEVSDEKE